VRRVAIKHHKMPQNVGTRRAIDYGISLCTNELIIKMDSDDIMISTRIQKQIDYMEKNPQVVCCGGQLMQFREDDNGTKIKMQVTNHPLAISEEHIKYWNWFMNHPTLCYRKWAILEVGGYGIGPNLGEDHELECKLWEHFGETSLYNMPNILLLYRIHNTQLSYNS
jgi:glycosyltransferase involved in cell wall biosynthesis